MKISEAFAEYRRIKVQGGGCSFKTDEGYKYAAQVVVSYFGDVSLRKLSVSQISDFYLDLTTNEHRAGGKCRVVSQNTARGYVMMLRAVIRFCHDCGVRTVDPSSIIIPKKEKKVARFIELEQFSALLAEVARPRRGYSRLNRARNIAILKMLFYTGLRVSELCALNRDSIYNRQFTVVGKSKCPRPCFITGEVEEEINQYLSMRTDSNPALFIANENGERITPGNVQRIFRLACARAGLTKVTPHTMRHSFATRLIDDRVDIRFVADLLGHQDLNTTKQYTHIRHYKLREIYMNVMERG